MSREGSPKKGDDLSKLNYKDVADMRFASPTNMASRLQPKQKWSKPEDGDVSVAKSTATSRRRKDQFNDPDAAQVLSSISGTTQAVQRKKSPTKNDNVLNELASAAILHDTPPSGPVEDNRVIDGKRSRSTSPIKKEGRPLSPAELKVKRILEARDKADVKVPTVKDETAAVASSVHLMELPTATPPPTKPIVARRPSPATTKGSPASPKILMELPTSGSGKKPIPRRPSPVNTTGSPHSTAGSPGSTTSTASRRQLDLTVNDNAFQVIADLVIEPLSKLPLSPEDKAKLDRTVPTRLRQGFIEAVRYRVTFNCPEDSNARVHVLTRKCQELGLDKEGQANPLVAIFNPLPTLKTPKPDMSPTDAGGGSFKATPPASETHKKASEESSEGKESSESKVPSTLPQSDRSTKHRRDHSNGSELTMPSGLHPATQAPTTESLARQQLVAELREASSFMAKSKTKEASKFWRNHVMELQSRLRNLHGSDSVTLDSDNKGTNEEILENNRRLLEDYNDPSTAMPPLAPRSADYVPPVAADAANNQVDEHSGSLSYTNTSVDSALCSSSSDSDGANSWSEARRATSTAVAYPTKMYAIIDLLIELLDFERLKGFLDLEKHSRMSPEERNDRDKLRQSMNMDKIQELLEAGKLRKYFVGEGFDDIYSVRRINEFVEVHKLGEFNAEKFKEGLYEIIDLLIELLDWERLQVFLDPEKHNRLHPNERRDKDKLRESMNMEKISELMKPENLRSYLVGEGLNDVYDVDRLQEIMEAQKLREVLDADRIQEVLQSKKVRSFMGSYQYRGATPFVDVVAPSDLEGDYRFEAEIDGHRFLAVVPKGGVKKGETFSCPMKDLNSVFGSEIPVGGWRDRLCDCFKNGVFHPVLLSTLLCPLLTLGQVMTRMRFDFLGRAHATGKPTYAVMWSVVIMWLMMNTMIFGIYNLKWSRRIELSIADLVALGLVNVVVLVFAIYSTANTRASLREKYMIREHRCYDVEDCCCATFCMPFTICQMARHTADYSKYEPVCCSETGLEEYVDVTTTGSDNSGINYFAADN